MGNLTGRIRLMTGCMAMLFVGILALFGHLNASFQSRALLSEIQRSSSMLADSILGGMTLSMSNGKPGAIGEQLTSLGMSLKGVDVVIFNAQKIVRFSTTASMKGENLDRLLRGSDLAAAVDTSLEGGRAPQGAFMEQIGGKPHLTILRPIPNQSRCHACHGSSTAPLGGLMVRRDIEEAGSLLAMLRGKSLLFGAAGFLVTGLALLFLSMKLVARPVRAITRELDEASAQVAAASGELSAASQSLAEGATEQAASIEETSSSLEEMASMTRRNAEQAEQAKRFMEENQGVVRKTNAQMQNLGESMKRMIEASGETARIIKTIDEIAFQTNLLALNAAVEAARAGEAGAGFAVVAEEVRSLAQRTAEAAKNTHQIIEENLESIRKSSRLVTAADEAFQKVETGSARASELVGEISAASGEQALGIEQINQAVAQMDKVVQENAASAEQTAAAAQQLSGQALSLERIVQQMVATVSGTRKGKTTGPASRPKAPWSPGGWAPVDGSGAGGNGRNRSLPPERVIPLEEDETHFQEF